MLPHKSIKIYFFITSTKFSNSSLVIPKDSAVQPKTLGGEPGGMGEDQEGKLGQVS